MMEDKTKRVRTPTVDPVEPASKTGSAYRKKLYRKRTFEEVGRGLNYTVGNATDGQETDPAAETVDAAVDTVRYAGNYSSDTIKAYSDKLKSRPKSEEIKRSEVLRSDHVKAYRHETVRTNSKNIQKDKIKRNYAKRAREAQQTAKNAGKTGAKAGKKAAEDTQSLITATLKKVAGFVSRHPIATLLIALILIVLLAIMAMVNSVGMIFGGASGGSISATYTAEDSEIYAAEASYAAKEAELQAKVDSIATTYPGYDEYRLDVDTIEHSPWSLTSVLTVIHEDFTSSGAEGTISSLFDAQYSFSTASTTVTKYRQEERTGYYGVTEYDDEGNEIGITYQAYTYYVQVPYDYHILTVTLVNNGLETVINGLGLDADKMELYEYLNVTHGEKDYLF